jgi:hypothetical protein
MKKKKFMPSFTSDNKMSMQVFIPDAKFIWLMAKVSTSACSGAENCVEVEITDPIFYIGHIEKDDRCDGQKTFHRRLVDLDHPALLNKRLPLQVRCEYRLNQQMCNNSYRIRTIQAQ